MNGIDDVKISPAAAARNLEFQLGLMEKQLKRVAELARFLPFVDQQEEMNELVKQLSVEAACLKFFALAIERELSQPNQTGCRKTNS